MGQRWSPLFYPSVELKSSSVASLLSWRRHSAWQCVLMETTLLMSLCHPPTVACCVACVVRTSVICQFQTVINIIFESKINKKSQSQSWFQIEIYFPQVQYFSNSDQTNQTVIPKAVRFHSVCSSTSTRHSALSLNVFVPWQEISMEIQKMTTWNQTIRQLLTPMTWGTAGWSLTQGLSESN